MRQTDMRSLIAAMILAAALAACGGAPAPSDGTPAPSNDQVRDYFSPPKPYPGPKWTRDGRPVKGRVLNSIAGPEHCGWQSAVLMHVGWPLGTVSKTIDEARQYVRDPKGVLDGTFQKGLRRNISLPDDAKDTGYRMGKLQLWLSASDPNGAYLRVDNDVERWPRAEPAMACA